MQDKTALQIQAELDFMRAMYQRQLDEDESSSRMLGWCLLAVIGLIPALAVAIIKLI